MTAPKSLFWYPSWDFALFGHMPCSLEASSSFLLLCVFLQDMHVISTDENQVFAAVQEWNQNDTYNLYISDTRGVYFTLALENVQSSRGPEGNIMIDLYEVCHKACVVLSHGSAWPVGEGPRLAVASIILIPSSLHGLISFGRGEDL